MNMRDALWRIEGRLPRAVVGFLIVVAVLTSLYVLQLLFVALASMVGGE
jgi:hypothetical protein